MCFYTLFEDCNDSQSKRARVCWPLLCLWCPFYGFFREVLWIRTHRVAVGSNSAIHLSFEFCPADWFYKTVFCATFLWHSVPEQSWDWMMDYGMESWWCSWPPFRLFRYIFVISQAPNSVVSERVRRRRNISEDDKYLLAANSSAVTRQRFADILEYVNPEVGYTILCCNAATLRRYSRICLSRGRLQHPLLWRSNASQIFSNMLIQRYRRLRHPLLSRGNASQIFSNMLIQG